MSLSDMIDSKEAQILLGTSDHEWDDTIGHPQSPIPLFPISGGNARHVTMVSRSALTDFVEALARDAPPINVLLFGCSTVAGRDRNRAVSLPKLIKAIESKEVNVVGRLTYAKGLASLVVNDSDIRSYTPGIRRRRRHPPRRPQ